MSGPCDCRGNLEGEHAASLALLHSTGGLPNGLSINTSTGTISGNIASGAARYGPFTVTVTVADETFSTSQIFTWEVINPITIEPIADQSHLEGDTINVLEVNRPSSG